MTVPPDFHNIAVYTPAAAAALVAGLANDPNKDPVRVATAGALPANTRVGNVLTANANGSLNTAGIDGKTDLAINQRVLVKDEATGANKGPYTITSLGGVSSKWSMTRATDADTSDKVKSGMTVYVSEGTANAKTTWTLTTADPITLNTTALTFENKATTVAGATAGSLGAVQLAGDLAGTGSVAAAPRTSGVNSVTYPAGGALTTGTVPRVTGPSAVQYGAVDLANINAVTGILPAVNIDSAVGGALYGDGSDGVAAFDGAAVVLGLAPVGTVYTLTRDIFLAGGSTIATCTIKQNGFRIFCNGTLTIAATGIVHNNGNAGANGAAGAGGAAGAATGTGSAGGIGAAGGAGGSGNAAGSNGDASAIGFPGATGGTGDGGAGGVNAGGTAGAFTAIAAAKGGARHLFALVATAVFGSTGLTVFGGGAGGGGGGGDNADAGGGGGGGGGGVCWIAAYNLVNAGAVSANGGAGGNGVSAANNAGGGGGGDGGVVIAISRTTSGAGTYTAAAGAGGTAAGAGVAGTAGTAGTVIQIAA